jgi:hypothetical protein
LLCIGIQQFDQLVEVYITLGLVLIPFRLGHYFEFGVTVFTFDKSVLVHDVKADGDVVLRSEVAFVSRALAEWLSTLVDMVVAAMLIECVEWGQSLLAPSGVALMDAAAALFGVGVSDMLVELDLADEGWGALVADIVVELEVLSHQVRGLLRLGGEGLAALDARVLVEVEGHGCRPRELAMGVKGATSSECVLLVWW